MRTGLFVLGCCFTASMYGQFPLTHALELRVGLQHVEVGCLAQDAQGLIWAGSDVGLLRSDGAYTRVVYPVMNSRVTAVAPVGDDMLAALAHGLVIRCGAVRCDTLLWEEELRSAPVVRMSAGADGTLWIGTYGAGLWQLRGGVLSRWSTAQGLPDAQVNDLAMLPDGRVVVATDQGLAICGMQGVERVLGQAEGAPDNLVLAVAVDEHGRVVAGTQGAGVFIWDPQATGNVVERLDPGYPMGVVLKVATQQGRIWVSSTRHGVMLYENSMATGNYDRYVSPREDVAHDLLADSDGVMWWCTGSDQLTRADPTVLWVEEHEDIDLRSISALCVDGRERIWFATPKGVFVHPATFVDTARVERVPLNLDPRKPVVSMAASSDGTVWAATFGNGVYAILPNGRVQHFTAREGLLNDNVLAVSCAGNVAWFGTLEGISAYRNGRFTHYRPQGAGFVYDVFPLGEDSAYGATDGNGVVLAHGTGSVITMGLNGNTYYSLTRDGQGRVWAAGPGSGLCAVPSNGTACTGTDRSAFKDDLYGIGALGQRVLVFSERGAWSHGPNDTWNDLTARLGLSGAKAGLNAICNDVQGALWLATDKGLVRIQDPPTNSAAHIPTRIVEVHVGNEAVDPRTELRTPHDRNDISFHLAAIHYVDPAAVAFEFRLLGYVERSRITRERQVSFALLPPGSYQFQVRAFTGEAPAADQPWSTFPFVVEAPWYRLPWVIALFLLVFLAIVVLLIRVRERRQRYRQRMEQDRVRFQLEALRSQVDPHFLFNSFNTLVELIESDPERAVGHVDQLSTFFRSILQLRDKELITLREELQLLDTYFALERSRFGHAIELQVEVAEDLKDRSVVPLTLQLLVENALKHNSATVAQPLSVLVRTEGDTLVVENRLLPRLSPPRSTGFGLHSIRQRYTALAHRPMEVQEADGRFVVRIPLIDPRP